MESGSGESPANNRLWHGKAVNRGMVFFVVMLIA